MIFVYKNYVFGGDSSSKVFYDQNESKLVKSVLNELPKGEKATLHFCPTEGGAIQYKLSKEAHLPASLALASSFENAVVIVKLPETEGVWCYVVNDGIVASISDVVAPNVEDILYLISDELEQKEDLEDFPLFVDPAAFDSPDVVDDTLAKSGFPDEIISNRQLISFADIDERLNSATPVSTKEVVKRGVNPKLFGLGAIAVLGMLLAYFFLMDDKPDYAAMNKPFVSAESQLKQRLEGDIGKDIKSNYQANLDLEMSELRLKLGMAANKSSIGEFLSLYESLPSSIAGWDLARIRYIENTDSGSGYLSASGSYEFIGESSWSRSELGTPRSLQGAFTGAKNISVSEDWNEALVWLASRNMISTKSIEDKDIEGYIKQHATSVSDVVSDLQTAGFAFKIGGVISPKRATPSNWGATASQYLDPYMPLVHYEEMSFEIQGIGLSDMLKAFRIISSYRTAYPSKITVNSAEDRGAWSVVVNSITGFKRVTTAQSLEAIANEKAKN